MLDNALAKLNEKQLAYLKALSFTINSAREYALKDDFEERRGKLRGFLECLCQMGVISGNEVKTLYMWFFREDRSER